MKQAAAVPARIVRRPLLVGLVAALALVCASCGGGTHHLASKPVDHSAQPKVKTSPATAPVPSTTTTTTTVPGVKTNANVFTPAPQPAPAPAPTTPATNPFPPACVWTNFASKVTTDQSSYAAGAPVQITLEFANAGPACTVNATGYACPLVNIDNASGALVWSNEAPTSTGCSSTFTGPTVLAANWSQSFPVTWGQDTCTPGPAACPGPQVPAGSYQVIGQSGGGSSQIPAGTPVTITLTS
jgi:hypothetical protein